jgi:hypothetical protein
MPTTDADGRRSAARPVLDEHCTQTFAGHVRQLVIGDDGHLGVLELRLIRKDAAKRQGGEKQRTQDAFHGGVFFGGGYAIRLAAEGGGQANRVPIMTALLLSRR